VTRQGCDRRRHRCREQQYLPAPRQQLGDSLHGVDEAEIEHPVGLVEREGLDMRQRERAAVDQGKQPAWRGDQNVDAGG
jgi:hypothetical protein